MKLEILFFVSLICLGSAQAQPYGLTSRPASAAFLNNKLPQAETSTTGWSAVDAFPSLSFDNPTFIVPQPRSNRLCVGSQQGIIHTFVDSSDTTEKLLFLDLSAVTQGAYDSGMMGLIFHPEFGLAGSPNRGYVYVSYSYSPSPIHDAGAPSDTPSYNRLSRFTVPDGELAADRDSEYVLINQYDRHLWHNGGGMCFGADGFLYLTNGDEGGYGNPYQQGQNHTGGLFGGVFRIDVDRDASRSHPIRRQPTSGATPPAGWPASFTQGYYIPNDNPWLSNTGAVLEEYYALGFRSPHRITFDAASGRLWLGDVGQSSREEVNLIEKGGNYQWGYKEGTISGPSTEPTSLIGTEKPPVYEYPHSNGYTAVIGGYVYRGAEHAAYLTGRYLFGDNGTSRIRAMSYDGSTTPSIIELCTLPNGGSETTGMSTFGLNHQQEPLMCCVGIGVKLYRLAKATSADEPPALLSETGAFSDLATLTPSADLIPYRVNAPLWSDHAVKFRWMSIPNDGAPYEAGETIDFSNTGAWTFPVGTVFVKHFELPINETQPNVRKRLETRFLVHGANGSYYGLTYKWRADNSDADLLPGSFQESVTITTATGPRQQVWSYPSRQDCMVCHTQSAGSVLGARTCQLNGDLDYGDVTDNQLRTLSHIGLFAGSLDEASIATLPKSANLLDSSASLELRVRSYLDSNCSHCHRPNGVRANFDARLETPLALQGIIRGEVADTLGISGAKLIVPSDVNRSMIRHRDSLLGANQMPPLARNLVDAEYITVLNQWINSMPTSYTLPVVMGSQSEGTQTDNITDTSGSYINANRFQAPSAGNLTQLHAKVAAIQGSYRCAVYSDAGGNPGTFLRSTSTLTNVSEGWQTFPLTASVSIEAGQYYWLAIWSDDVNARVYNQPGGNLRWAKYDFGSWPSSPTLNGASSLTYSIYASGPGGSGSSSTPSRGIISGNYSWQPPSSLVGAKFTAVGLPSGLKIHPSTGEVSGLPLVSGRFSVKIRETLGRTVVTQTYTLVVEGIPTAMTGSYAGLVNHDAAVNAGLGGSLRLTVATTGAVTGRLQHGSLSYPLSGRLSTSTESDPTFKQTISRPAMTPLIVDLVLSRSTFVITGTVNAVAVNARHDLVVAPGTPESSQTLNVLLSIPAADAGDLNQPQGTGWMRLTQKVSRTQATVTGLGKLSDGTALSFATTVGDNLDAPLRSLLYQGKGSLQGSSRLVSSSLAVWPPVYQISGSLEWRKNSRASLTDYSYASIAQSLTMNGHSYRQPNSGMTLLGNNDAPANAIILFTEAGLLSSNKVDQTFQLTAKHRALFGSTTVNPAGVTLLIDAAKGSFTGTFRIKNGNTFRPATFSGLFTGGFGEGAFTIQQLPLARASPVLSGKVRVTVP